MKKTLITALLIAIIACGILFAAGSSNPQNPLGLARATVNMSPQQARTPTAIAPTTNDIYATPHSNIVKLPNGTLCTIFNSNQLGTSLNDAVYVASSNDNGTTWQTTKVSNFSKASRTIISPNGTITEINPEYNQGTLGTTIACDANNNIYAVWSGFSNDDLVWQIWCSTYNSSTWSAPAKVSRGLEPRLDSVFPSVAVDGNNRVHVVWDTSRNGNETHEFEHTKIFYAQYNGTWSTPTLISASLPVAPFFEFTPVIVVDSTNNLHVIWAGSDDQAATEGDLWYAKYNGTWQTPIRLISSAYAGSFAMYLQAPAIATDSKNNLHVVWQGAYDTKYRTDQIWYLNYTNSASKPTMISYVPLMNSSDQQTPSIAIDDRDQIHVMWMSKRESVLFYSRYANSSWSTPVQAEEFSSTYPHLSGSTFPKTNRVTAKLDYIFSRGFTLMFNSLSTTETPHGLSFSASITPISEIISVGQTLNLSAQVIAGNAPYKYEWQLNGTKVKGETSSSYLFKPTTTGTHTVTVAVTDADNITVSSDPAQIEATTNFVQGSFGYSAKSGEAGGGSSSIAYGSRFTLRVEANITSMSALLSVYPPPSYGNPNFTYKPTFNYRFAIYSDNNNSIGNLIAQTKTGTALVGAQYQEIFKTANFATPVHLNPGAYWLMEVTDASEGQLNINGPQTNDYNQSISVNINGMNFPNTTTQTKTWLGHLYCIYASWEINSTQTVTQNQNLFAATSNSTVSSLTYNSTAKQLSFTVTGPNGTTGYADIYISKTLIQNPNELTVSIDGKTMSFTSSSIDNFWILHFSYTHSTHRVNINLQTTIPEIPSATVLPLVVSLASATAILLPKSKTAHKQKTN